MMMMKVMMAKEGVVNDFLFVTFALLEK